MSSVYKLPSGLKKDEIMKRYRAYPKIKQLQKQVEGLKEEADKAYEDGWDDGMSAGSD